MPPRFAYWTILIDDKPTAFRAREHEELLPTLQQLRRTNNAVVLKWFARGRLWDTPEAAQAASHLPAPLREKRGHDWRPGGAHKDPRDRFNGAKRRDQRIHDKGPEGQERHRRAGPSGFQPWRDKPAGAAPRGSPPRREKPHGAAPRGSQPWHDKPAGQPPRGARPWRDRPNAKPPGAVPAGPQAPRPAEAAAERREADSARRRESSSQPPSPSESRAIKPDSPNRR